MAEKQIKNVFLPIYKYLYILSGSGIESDIKQKRDEALPLGKSMTPETHYIIFDVNG